MKLLDKAAAMQRAIELTQLGLRTKIVHIETGVAVRNLRRLYRECFGRPAPPGLLPEPAGIMCNRRRTEESALFLWTYSRLHTDATKTLQLDRLCAAHRIYLRLRRRWDGDGKIALEINEAWVLARALRAGEIKLGVCTHGYTTLHSPTAVIGCDELCEQSTRVGNRPPVGATAPLKSREAEVAGQAAIDERIRQITESLRSADLTAMQRNRLIGEWIHLTSQSQAAAVPGGGTSHDQAGPHDLPQIPSETGPPIHAVRK